MVERGEESTPGVEQASAKDVAAPELPFAATPASDPLAPAFAANRLILLLVVFAIAQPMIIYYTGFQPVSTLKLWYPRILGYPERRTPDMDGSHGIDFSQIYLSAKRLSRGKEVYFPVDRERWRRKWSSTYHPFAHWLYLPVAQLRFRPALVVHNLFSVSLLLACGFWLLKRAGQARASPGVAAAALSLLYLTPTGLLHMERGQLDLYTAAAYTCTFGVFALGGTGFALAAGAISSLKVTSWLFIALYWCVGQALRGWRERAPWLLPGTIAALLLLFAGQVMQWFPSVLYVATDREIKGPAFNRILPDWLPQLLPFALCILVGLACFHQLRSRSALGDTAARRRLFDRVSFPFAAALALLALGATPVTHDYRLVALIGLLPALPVWCERVVRQPAWLRYGVSLAFAGIVVIVHRVRPFSPMPYEETSWTMLAFAALFLAAALYLVFASSETDSAKREALGAGPLEAPTQSP